MDVSRVLSNTTGSKGYDRSQHVGTYTRCSSFEEAKEANRFFRCHVASQFLRGCTFDNVHKTCVLSSGGTYCWFDKSYGIMWVGVHGIGDSICVVANHSDLDMTRVGPSQQTLPKDSVMRNLTKTLLSGVEGLPYDDKFRERSGQSIKKPFGVVSVFPVTRKCDEKFGQLTSSVEYDENKAINFLKEKMKSESAITFDGTIKTAISAFQQLCLQELKAEEFWVICWNGGETYHLHVHEIEEHLSAINGSSGVFGSGSSSSSSSSGYGTSVSGSGRGSTVRRRISSSLTVGDK